MAKELPFFKFEPSQWDNGSIQACSCELKGVFIDLCSMYWQRLGVLPFKLAVQKICAGNATALNSLCEDKIFEVIDGAICIDFLNEQLSEFGELSSKNSENARLGWEKRRNKATALPSQSDRNAIRGEERRGEKKRGDKIPTIDNVATNVATIENRKKVFFEKVALQLPNFSKEMLRDFFDYWTEMNEGGKKMRFEMQKVFDISRRLKTWSKNDQFRNTKKNGFDKLTDAKQQSDAIIRAKYGNQVN